MTTDRPPSARDVASVLLHALVLWVSCGAVIGIGREVLGFGTAVIVHALLVPVLASIIARSYFRRHGQLEPPAVAAIFMVFVFALAAGLAAPVFE